MEIASVRLNGSVAWLHVCSIGLLRGDDKTNSQSSPQNALAATAPVEPEGTKIAHDGSINDIDAIGHRNVGCAARASNILTLPSCGYG